jgi:RNA polymerase sigma factor (sigma-70 family)
MDIEQATAAVVQWKPLLLKVCWEYGRHYHWLHDDFVSDAFLALWKDLLKPTPIVGELGGSLVATIVKRAIWVRLKQERSKNRPAFSPAALHDDGEQVDSLALIACRETDEVARIDIADSLDTLLDDLRLQITERLNGATYVEIARRCGTSHQAVQQRVKNAIWRLAEDILA